MKFNALALLLGSTTALVSPAFAQDRSPLIEEILVTAQKRSESIQEVPISIVALTGDQLDRTAQTDILAIAGRMPTLQYSSAGGEAQLYIRGVGSNLLAVGSDPSVAINLDGVYLGRPNMGLSQFLDVERVEVLRGPQGTLYGRNATGGAINITSRQPGDETEGYLKAGYGRNNTVELQGAATLPVSDMLSIRAAVRHLEDDGYTDNLDARGATVDDNDLYAGRVIAALTPSDSVRASLQFDWSTNDTGNTSLIPNDDKGASRLAGYVAAPDIHTIRNDLNTFMDWDTGGPTLDIEADVSDTVTLKSITAYKSFEMDYFFNTDGTDIAVTRTTEQFDTEQFSQELRLLSQGEGPLEWIVGGYYLHEDKEGALGLVRENLRNAVTGAALPIGVFIIPAENKTKAYAAFAQASYDVTDQFTVTAGIRYSDEKKRDFNEQINVFPTASITAAQIAQGLYGGINLSGLARAGSRSDRRSWDAVTPKFGVEFRANDDVLLYASATRGFKSGGYNDYQPSNPVFNPEFIWSYEAGVKSDLADGRVRLNAAAFYYDYSDLQVTTFLNSLTLVANAAQADVKGLDLELVTQPADALTFGAQASLLDATYDSFLVPYGVCSPLVLANATCAGRTAGQARLITADGNRLNNAPKFKGTAFAEYTTPVGSGSLTLFGQISHTGSIYFNAANDPVARQDSYTLVDGRVSWAPEQGGFEIAAYGKNIFNKNYFHNIVQFTSTSLTPPATALPGAGVPVTDPFSVGHALGYPAPGAQWGIELTYRF